ncbi:class I SAM-dependent DNA methyltransferase [Roseibium sp.]|uniref:class I SAM-dependent DNA methyltransferase n=1 Tax=Roseibium sp. TaxID=1936156 RepID=UPI003A96D77B
MKNANTSAPRGFSSLKAGSTDTEAIAVYYDGWASTYDETLAGWEYEAPNDIARLVASHLKDDALILDVGCGTGLVSQALNAGRGERRLHGIDISSQSLKQAEKRGAYERLFCHDLQKPPLPLTSNAYDAAVCVGVLTYVEDAGPLFHDLCRCVRSGGVIAFTQRVDRWEQPDFDRVIGAVADQRLWKLLDKSAPQSYLPGNADFGEEIKIILTLCQVL